MGGRGWGQGTPAHEPPRTGEADRWTRIDAAADPTAFVRELDAISARDTVRAQKELTYRLLAVGAGDRVLDVGCGTGEDVRALARLVGPAGRAVGVDVSETVLAEARRRAEGEAGEALPVEFRPGTPPPCRSRTARSTPAGRSGCWSTCGSPSGRWRSCSA